MAVPSTDRTSEFWATVHASAATAGLTEVLVWSLLHACTTPTF